MPKTNYFEALGFSNDANSDDYKEKVTVEMVENKYINKKEQIERQLRVNETIPQNINERNKKKEELRQQMEELERAYLDIRRNRRIIALRNAIVNTTRDAHDRTATALSHSNGTIAYNDANTKITEVTSRKIDDIDLRTILKVRGLTIIKDADLIIKMERNGQRVLDRSLSKYKVIIPSETSEIPYSLTVFAKSLNTPKIQSNLKYRKAFLQAVEKTMMERGQQCNTYIGEIMIEKVGKYMENYSIRKDRTQERAYTKLITDLWKEKIEREKAEEIRRIGEGR